MRNIETNGLSLTHLAKSQVELLPFQYYRVDTAIDQSALKQFFHSLSNKPPSGTAFQGHRGCDVMSTSLNGAQYNLFVIGVSFGMAVTWNAEDGTLARPLRCKKPDVSYILNHLLSPCALLKSQNQSINQTIYH